MCSLDMNCGILWCLYGRFTDVIFYSFSILFYVWVVVIFGGWGLAWCLPEMARRSNGHKSTFINPDAGPIIFTKMSDDDIENK